MFTQERDNEKPNSRGRYRLVPSDPQPAMPEGCEDYVHVMLVPIPDDEELTAEEVAA